MNEPPRLIQAFHSREFPLTHHQYPARRSRVPTLEIHKLGFPFPLGSEREDLVLKFSGSSLSDVFGYERELLGFMGLLKILISPSVYGTSFLSSMEL